MERQFQINWQVLVEEAKQRRKDQRMTQQRLATLAHVSTPTVSRFECGKKDVQLSSVISILKVLGLVDERSLTFPEPKGRYDGERMSVLFEGSDGANIVRCAISRETLNDHFGGDGRGPLKVFTENIERIEHEVRCKYLAGKMEPDGSILIQSSDL